MKKLSYRTVFVVLITLPCLMITLCCILWLFGQHFYFPPFSSEEIVHLSGWTILFLLILWFGVYWCRRSRKWYGVVAKVLVLILVTLFIAWVLLIAAAFGGWMGVYQRFDSPDAQHSIVVEDESVLAVEWTTVYVMTSPITMKKVGSFGGGFYPSSQNILWRETYVELISGRETLLFDYTQ